MAMKSLANIIKSSLYDFIDGHSHYPHQQDKQKPISLQSNKNIATINEAMESNTPVHLICSEKDLTGLITKYNIEIGQLILKNNNVTQIVTISEIKKISILPKNKA